MKNLYEDDYRKICRMLSDASPDFLMENSHVLEEMFRSCPSALDNLFYLRLGMSAEDVFKELLTMKQGV